MKNCIDKIIIQISFIIEFIINISFKYSKYLYYSYLTKRTPEFLFDKYEANISYSISYLISLIFYILIILYVLVIIKWYINNKIIDLKTNSKYLLSILIFDIMLYLFNIKAMIYESNAFRFVIIGLLTNLIVYIKYKKNNIKIE